MATGEAATGSAGITVCLDPTSYEAISYFIAGVPGAGVVGNLDHYSGAERSIRRALALARTRICFIDYDENSEEAIWITARLRAEYPDVHCFAVSSHSEPDKIIGAMRAGCAECLSKPVEHER